MKLYPSKRGCKDYTNFYENNTTKMVSCYPELAFHENPADARFILDNKQPIAEALAKGVCAYFGVAYVPASTTGGTTVAQNSELDRLREENGKLQQDVINLNAKISARKSKIEKVKQAFFYIWSGVLFIVCKSIFHMSRIYWPLQV